MIDRAETVRRIERSIADWPYLASSPGYTLAMLKAARDQLKEQMPHVLSMEEAERHFEIDRLEREPVWVERRNDSGFWMVGAFADDELSEITQTGWLFTQENYDRKWRLWTAKPTEEQRKAAKWNDA